MSKKLNVRLWKEGIIRNPYKQGMPVLSFPCVSLMGITFRPNAEIH